MNAHDPDLKKYLDKKLNIKLNANRKITGVLAGFDPFMNLAFNDAEEILPDGQAIKIGTVVVRGNSVNLLETASV